MSDAKLYRHGLPSSLDAERMVLGSIILNHANFDAVAAILEPADFSLESNRRVFARMKELSTEGKPIDRITLAEALDAAGELKGIGGLSFLSDLGEGIPQLSNLDAYVRIVQDKATKRRAILEYQKAIDELIIDADDAPELLEKAERAISALRAGREQGGFRTPLEIVREAGGIDRFLSPQALRGIPTPWEGLNQMLTGGGFSPGQLVVIGARPGGGKTALAANLAVGVVRRWLRCAYVSLEMTSADMLRRMICSRANVSLKKLSHLESSPLEREEIAEAFDELAAPDHPGLLLWKNQTATVLSIRAEMRREAVKMPVAMLVVDYLQLMESVASTRRSEQNRNNEIAEMSRGLKLLAMELKCVVVLLSQLSRDQEKQDRRPRLSDLRDSGAIESDADIVLFPWTKAVDVLPEVVDYELIVAKQRNGPVGMVPLSFFRKYVRFDSRVMDAFTKP